MVARLTQTPQGPIVAILQYNCGNANYRTARPFFDQLDPGRHQIVAVQEPGFNAKAKSTYCPPGYHLAYRPEASTRVCFMISRALDIGSWECRTEHADIAVLTLRTGYGPIDIVNVYNPKPYTSWSRAPSRLPEVAEAIESSITKGREVILLGDFNLHHPQ